MVDRKSASEILLKKREEMLKAQKEAAEKEAKSAKKTLTRKTSTRKRKGALQRGMEASAKSIAYDIGKSIGGKHAGILLRGILGGMMRR